VATPVFRLVIPLLLPNQLAQINPSFLEASGSSASTAPHRAIVEQLIAPQSEHYQPLRRVHSALLTGIQEVTGAPAPWTPQSSR
jgi:hypothetical protein